MPLKSIFILLGEFLDNHTDRNAHPRLAHGRVVDAEDQRTLRGHGGADLLQRLVEQRSRIDPVTAVEAVFRRPVRVGPPAEADEVRERRPVRQEQRRDQVRPEPSGGGRP
jgi:hypothetical protein